jgi:hypothetical protein
MSKKLKSKLNSFHRKDLERSGLKNKTIRAAKFHSMSDTIRLSAIAGCKCRSNLGSCLVIPYRDITGKLIDYAVIKPKNPRTKNGKCIKYVAPSGQPNHCYFPPNIAEFAADSSRSLIITEGAKKTLAAFQSGFACIGVSGVWNWKKKNKEELIPDFSGVNWDGRDVTIVFDSDAAQSDHIQLAEMRLAGCLTRLGANVTIARLPNFKGLDKTGLDDFLKKKSSGELERILRKAEPAGLTNSISINLISDSLLAYTGGFPKSAGGQLFVLKENGDLDKFKDQADLFSWMHAKFGSTVKWTRGNSCPSKEEFFRHLHRVVPNFDVVSSIPHYPKRPRVFYHHSPQLTKLLASGTKGKHLKKLLGYFQPDSEIDAELLKSLFLTPAWGGNEGSRPAFLILGPENDRGRGVGKSTLVEILGDLYGKVMDFSRSEPFTKLKSRLLSSGARGKSICRIDNVKADHFAWGDIEGLLTSSTVSGSELFKGEGQRPNNLTWCITLNGPSLGEDLAQRCIPIRLGRPTRSPAWERKVRDFIEEFRDEILADIISTLKMETSEIENCTRWAEWEQGVLAHVENQAKCLEMIEKRQREFDTDHSDIAYFRSQLLEQISKAGFNPEKDKVFISSALMNILYSSVTEEDCSLKLSTTRVKAMAIPELSIDPSHKRGRGFIYTGPKSGKKNKSKTLSRIIS